MKSICLYLLNSKKLTLFYYDSVYTDHSIRIKKLQKHESTKSCNNGIYISFYELVEQELFASPPTLCMTLYQIKHILALFRIIAVTRDYRFKLIYTAIRAVYLATRNKLLENKCWLVIIIFSK